MDNASTVALHTVQPLHDTAAFKIPFQHHNRNIYQPNDRHNDKFIFEQCLRSGIEFEETLN